MDYTRLITTTIDLSLFATGADVISSIKALRVTQDPSLKDNPNYHYEWRGCIGLQLL